MRDLEILNKFRNVFEKEEFGTRLMEASEEMPLSCLIVELGPDTKERERFCSVTAFEQELGQSLEKEAEGAPLLNVIFEAELPFEVKPAFAKELGSLLHFINRQLPLPGFELDEVENLIYYRYSLFAAESGIDARALMSILGLMLLFLDLYTHPVEQVASGAKSFNELMEEVVAISEEL